VYSSSHSHASLSFNFACSPSHSYVFLVHYSAPHRALHSFPTRRSSDLRQARIPVEAGDRLVSDANDSHQSGRPDGDELHLDRPRSEEHTSELQSPDHLVCRLLLEKKKKKKQTQAKHDSEKGTQIG